MIPPPQYNPTLDAMYGFSGRGIRKPMRYGLSTSQLEKLIEDGKWQDWYLSWLTQRRTWFEKTNNLCIICGKVPIRPFVILGQNICHPCCKKIDKRMAVRRKDNDSARSARRNSKGRRT